VAEVDPDDDSVSRDVVRYYAYDPARHERRHQTIIAFDDRVEFESYIHDAIDRLRARPTRTWTHVRTTAAFSSRAAWITT